MPELDIQKYSAMAPIDLEQIRRTLIQKAAGNHENLTDEDLHQLAAVTGVLRRKASGPPKAVKEPKAPRAKKAGPAALDDLA